MQLLLLPVLALFVSYQAPIDLAAVDGVVGPVSARFITDAIAQAERDEAQLLIIQLDTPGGLDTAMREIVKGIFESRVAICVYVFPPGGRAASAGVFVAMAAHVVAMAPGTNIGAAHPVTIGREMDEEMAKKVTNDAAAYIKSIAEKRERNAEWAESAVRESVSITGEEAVEEDVIDLVAADIDELLWLLDGWKVEVDGKEVVLATEEAPVIRIEMGFRDRLLARIADPNVAYILMLLGIFGLFFELQNPGAIFPGVVGVICLILAFFAFQTLPINYAGLILIVFGVILFILETQITSYGMLTVGGVICMFLGSFMLIRVTPPVLQISWKVIIPSVLAAAIFFVFAIGMALRAQRRKPTTGMKGIVGEIGVARTNITGAGKVFVHGEIWNATSQEVIKKGERVKVVGIEGLTLEVEKI
jgi:membrane-bound serine protease (ClpP class)